MRSAGAMKSTDPCLVTFWTKAMMFCFGAESLHEDRGSATDALAARCSHEIHVTSLSFMLSCRVHESATPFQWLSEFVDSARLEARAFGISTMVLDN